MVRLLIVLAIVLACFGLSPAPAQAQACLSMGEARQAVQNGLALPFRQLRGLAGRLGGGGDAGPRPRAFRAPGVLNRIPGFGGLRREFEGGGRQIMRGFGGGGRPRGYDQPPPDYGDDAPPPPAPPIGDLGGQVVSVQLCRAGQLLNYLVSVLGDDGAVKRYRFDAQTGQQLGQ